MKKYKPKKYKPFTERLKLASILVTVLCLSVLIYLFFKPTGPEIPTGLETICNTFQEKSVTDACISVMGECEQDKDPITCAAVRLSEIDIEASRQVCLMKKSKMSQQWCLALSLARVDLNASLVQCDMIEFEVEKYHCRADMLRFEDLEGALKECDKITSPDYVLWCKASVYRAIDLTKVSEYCDPIVDQNIKESCK